MPSFTTINRIKKDIHAKHGVTIPWSYIRGCADGMQVDIYFLGNACCVNLEVEEMIWRCWNGLSPIEGVTGVVEVKRPGKMLNIKEMAERMKLEWYYVKGCVDGMQVPKTKIGNGIFVDQSVKLMVYRCSQGFAPVKDTSPVTQWEIDHIPMIEL